MIRTASLLIAAALGAVLLVSGSAHAMREDWRIGPSRTIQSFGAALQGAFSNTRIIADPGIYHECITVTQLVLISLVGKKGVVIDATGCPAGITIADGVNITIDGLTIVNATTDGIVVQAAASTVHITKTTIQDAATDPAQSVLQTGISILGAEDVTLEKVTIRGATAQAVHVVSTMNTIITKSVFENGIGTGLLVDLGKGTQVVKNKFQGLLGPAVRFFHAGQGVMGGAVDSEVIGNKVTESQGGGFEIGGTSNLVEKNTIVDVATAGISALANGGSSTYRKNTITRAAFAGILAAGTGDTFDSNTVKEPVNDGVEVTGNGNGNTFTKTKVSKSGGAGFLLQSGATGNHFDGCSASKSGGDGFRVNGVTNTFTKVKASGSTFFDLNDPAGAATTNVYTDCKFKTSNLP